MTKCFTNSDYNKFTGGILNAKIKEKGLGDISDISGFMNNSELGKKIVTLATNAGLKVEQGKIVKHQAVIFVVKGILKTTDFWII